MLKRILEEFESAPRGISINQLSHKIGVERGALEGMIDYLVRKGKLQDDDAVQAPEAEACSTGGCGTCPGAGRCPFVMEVPRTFSLSTREKILN